MDSRMVGMKALKKVLSSARLKALMMVQMKALMTVLSSARLKALRMAQMKVRWLDWWRRTDAVKAPRMARQILTGSNWVQMMAH